MLGSVSANVRIEVVLDLEVVVIVRIVVSSIQCACREYDWKELMKDLASRTSNGDDHSERSNAAIDGRCLVGEYSPVDRALLVELPFAEVRWNVVRAGSTGQALHSSSQRCAMVLVRQCIPHRSVQKLTNLVFVVTTFELESRMQIDGDSNELDRLYTPALCNTSPGFC